MSTVLTLEAEKRSEDLNPRQLRQTGKVPATIYGKGVESVSVQLDTKTFDYEIRKKPESVEINLEGQTIPVSVQNVQRVFTTDAVLSVEFKRI
ncbi:MAG: hypothetical protein WCK67_09405 [bacterium]